MADIGSGESVGIMAKIGGASLGGALWGIFASGFLVIPVVLGSLLSPFFRKAHTVVNNKINSQSESTSKKAQTQKMSKTDKTYHSRMEALENERRLAQLQEEMQRLKNKAQKSKRQTTRSTAQQTI